MAFVIKKKESFIWPVKIKSPADGGKYDEQTLNLEFKKLKSSEMENLLKGNIEGGDKGFCRMIVLGWKDVKDSEGKDVPFSSDGLEGLLEEYGCGKAIASAYFEALAGAVEKN